MTLKGLKGTLWGARTLRQDDSPEILEAAGVEVRLGVHASLAAEVWSLGGLESS